MNPNIIDALSVNTWERKKLRAILKARNERNKPELPLLTVAREKGVFIRATDGSDGNHNAIPEDLTNYKVAKEGYLVINKMKAWQGSLGVAPCDGIVSPAYFVFEFKIHNKKFGHYLLRSKPYVNEFAKFSDGVRIGQWDLSILDMKNIEVLLPPPKIQDSIVKYLDIKVRKIDHIIFGKLKQKEFLNERKEIKIQEAVLKGFNKKHSYFPTGVNWIGAIPKNWNVVPARQIISSKSHRNRPDLPLLSVTRERGVIPREGQTREENHNYIPDDLSGYKIALSGDLIINKMKAWQGSLGIAPCDGIVSPAYYVYSVAPKIHGRYLQYLLKSKRYVEILRSLSEGVRTGQWDLDPIALKGIPLILPPKEEQLEIINYLDNETSKTTTQLETIQKQINNLQEYKSRLISDAVTGNIKKLEIDDDDKNELEFNFSSEIDEENGISNE
jgi:type I restriction enzyme, S subunit